MFSGVCAVYGIHLFIYVPTLWLWWKAGLLHWLCTETRNKLCLCETTKKKKALWDHNAVNLYRFTKNKQRLNLYLVKKNTEKWRKKAKRHQLGWSKLVVLLDNEFKSASFVRTASSKRNTHEKWLLISEPPPPSPWRPLNRNAGDLLVSSFICNNPDRTNNTATYSEQKI